MSELRQQADELQTEVVRRVGVEEGLVAQLKSNRLQTADSERLFRLLVDSVKDYAIFVLGPAGHITTWNEGAKLLKGYNADEIIGDSAAATTEADANDDETMSAVKNA